MTNILCNEVINLSRLCSVKTSASHETKQLFYVKYYYLSSFSPNRTCDELISYCSVMALSQIDVSLGNHRPLRNRLLIYHATMCNSTPCSLNGFKHASHLRKRSLLKHYEDHISDKTSSYLSSSKCMIRVFIKHQGKSYSSEHLSSAADIYFIHRHPGLVLIGFYGIPFHY